MSIAVEPQVVDIPSPTTLSNRQLIERIRARESASRDRDLAPTLTKGLVIGGAVCLAGTIAFGFLAAQAPTPEQGAASFGIALSLAALGLVTVVPGWFCVRYLMPKLSEFCEQTLPESYSIENALFHQAAPGLSNGYTFVKWDEEIIAQATIESGVAYLDLGGKRYRKESVLGLSDLYEVVEDEMAREPSVRYERKSLIGESFEKVQLVFEGQHAIEFELVESSFMHATYNVSFAGSQIGVLVRKGSGVALYSESWDSHLAMTLAYFMLHNV